MGHFTYSFHELELAAIIVRNVGTFKSIVTQDL